MRFAGDRRPQVEAKHAEARGAMRRAKATAEQGRPMQRQDAAGRTQYANGPIHGRVIGADL